MDIQITDSSKMVEKDTSQTRTYHQSEYPECVQLVSSLSSLSLQQILDTACQHKYYGACGQTNWTPLHLCLPAGQTSWIPHTVLVFKNMEQWGRENFFQGFILDKITVTPSVSYLYLTGELCQKTHECVEILTEFVRCKFLGSLLAF